MCVLIDISNEPDDEESLVRFLAYVNEFDVEEIVAATSTHLKDLMIRRTRTKIMKYYGEDLNQQGLKLPRVFHLALDRLRSHARVIEKFRKGHAYISKKHIQKIFDRLATDVREAIDRLLEADKAERLTQKTSTPIRNCL